VGSLDQVSDVNDILTSRKASIVERSLVTSLSIMRNSVSKQTFHEILHSS